MEVHDDVGRAMRLCEEELQRLQVNVAHLQHHYHLAAFVDGVGVLQMGSHFDATVPAHGLTHHYHRLHCLLDAAAAVA